MRMDLLELDDDCARVDIGGSRVFLGTTSWADRGLVQAGTFYPRKTMTARARLGFYASRFPLAEVATTYRFPPTPDLCAQWVERTPPGFVFDIRAWSLFTGAPTLPDSLWPDLQGAVADRHRDRRRLYPTHLPDDVLDECWDRFTHALRPLRDAGRLGVVVFQYPGWFSPRPEAWAELALMARRMDGFRVAVEMRSPKWLAGDDREPVLEWLEDHGLAYVCVDGPGEGPRAGCGMVASTADVAVVRFIGRRQVEDQPWTSPYRYRADELAGWVDRIRALAASSPEVHVLMDNCWGSDAVDNATELFHLLRATGGAGRPAPPTRDGTPSATPPGAGRRC
ncbi:MAG TPA: DUF72 domain-containing protein [Acidimicrobiales bacterium]|nr:DUF72 domain-containing protein [Acidimicrobiales bacterium]